MLVSTHEIFWHAGDGRNMPVFGLDISRHSARLATAGADATIRVWNVVAPGADGRPAFRHLADLTRHTKPVNQVRFCPSGGELIASASDDTLVYIWQRNDGQDHNEGASESWGVIATLHGHISDVTSVAWSPNARRLVSGEIQHRIIIWNVSSATALMTIPAHSKFVKGVCWDPCDAFIVSQSCDRTCAVFRHQRQPKPKESLCALVKTLKSTRFLDNEREDGKSGRATDLFSDDGVMSYFRRPCWSPDGTFLVTPTAVFQDECCTLVWHRDHLEKPLYVLKSPKRPTTAVAFCPSYFQLQSALIPDTKRLPLQYRMIFAIACNDGSLSIHDTEMDTPIAIISGLHLSQITDLGWLTNGEALFVSSSDGYVSTVSFSSKELGDSIAISDYAKFGISAPISIAASEAAATPGTSSGRSSPSRPLPERKAVSDPDVEVLQPRRIVPQLQPRRVPLIHIDD